MGWSFARSSAPAFTENPHSETRVEPRAFAAIAPGSPATTRADPEASSDSARVVMLMTPACIPGTIRSRSPMLSAPEASMSSRVITVMEDGLLPIS